MSAIDRHAATAKIASADPKDDGKSQNSTAAPASQPVV